jgi:transcriptional regulator with GAF, ATPase, and Fis domain
MAKLSQVFNTIRARLILAFSIFTATVGLMVAIVFWSQSREYAINEIIETIQEIEIKVEEAGNLEKEFYLSESNNLEFYETGNSIYLSEHKEVLKSIKAKLSILRFQEELAVEGLSLKVDSVTNLIEYFEDQFDTLVSLTVDRGFKSYGLEGNMRRALGKIQNSGFSAPENLLALVKRNETDFLMTKDSLYVVQTLQVVDSILFLARKKVSDFIGLLFIESAIDDYKQSFSKLVGLDEKIGFTSREGIRGKLYMTSESIEKLLMGIKDMVSQRALLISERVKAALIVSFVFLIGFMLLQSFLVVNLISKPIAKLSKTIHDTVENDFSGNVDVAQIVRKDEVGQLSRDFQFILDKVRERTAEVFAQKEEISRSYDLVLQLRNMGQEITATLSIDKIIETLYHCIGSLMEVDVLLLGFYNRSDNTLEFRNGRIKGNQIPNFKIGSDRESFLAVWCFNKQREVITLNRRDESSTAFGSFQSLVPGETTQTVVYLPLTTKNNRIGVISVQNYLPHAFNENQVNILRNLAVYTVIALDNALIYENLEDTVRERTKTIAEQRDELEAQKQAVERSYENIKLLSDIGREVTSYLDIESITAQLYEQVRKLMDADVFGIGIVKDLEGQIVFEGSFENGKVLPAYGYNFDDPDSFSALCYREQREILVYDLQSETSTLNIDEDKYLETESGVPQSLVYVPVRIKSNKIVGVLGVQSYRKNAYSSYHLNILQNLSLYIAIAIENAESYEQIEQQSHQLQKSSKKITDSINYAKRIQEAILPDLKIIEKALPDSFVYYKPRDIVSGDFFWFYQYEQFMAIAAVDCTGHGVPGAFMSLIGSNLLYNAIIDHRIFEPDKVLNLMRDQIREELKQDETENRDGMDISLCIIDKNRKVLSFAGAHHPLLCIKGTELIYLKGDKMSIGGQVFENEQPFNLNEIEINEPLIFYIFTDGYKDQFGTNGRKLSGPRFRELLETIHNKSVYEQREILDLTFESWIGKDSPNMVKQTDDVLVIGVRLDPQSL